MNSSLVLRLSSDILVTGVEAWQWKIGQPVSVLLTTLFGDMFLETASGEVHWLDTGAGSIQRVAASVDELDQLLQGDEAEKWLLPQLVERLRTAGKVLGDQQCYTLIILPVFNEGKYEVENIAVVPAIQHFRLTADIHKQIANLPDGAQIRLKVVD